MKKEKLAIGLAAGAGAAAILYYFLSKGDIPEGATAVQPFDPDKYLGKWYEVARLPNPLEKNIKSLTEEYSWREDGLISVVTRGYNVKKDKWTEFTGKAKSAGTADIGMLKVSYFGNIYFAYNVLDLDEDYQYAMVSGSGLGYLWIMSRDTTIPDNIKERFLKKAVEIGFPVNKLAWDIL